MVMDWRRDEDEKEEVLDGRGKRECPVRHDQCGNGIGNESRGAEWGWAASELRQDDEDIKSATNVNS